MSIIFAFLYSLDHFLGRGIRHGNAVMALANDSFLLFSTFVNSLFNQPFSSYYCLNVLGGICQERYGLHGI